MVPQLPKLLVIIPPQALVNAGSWTTAEIDTKGFAFARVYFALGALDAALTALAVTHSDTSGSGHANVTGLVFGTSVNSAGDTSALPTATDDNTVFCFDIDLRGIKRYIDLTATIGSGSNGGYAYAWVELFRGEKEPATAAQAGLNQLLSHPYVYA